VNGMEQKIYDILVKIQSSMEELNERLKRVEGTVNRIETTNLKM
jgi:translation elongation factor EF-1beta